MCDVPSTAVLCGESYLCFLGMASRFFFELFFTIPVAPVITGKIIQFIYYTQSLYRGADKSLARTTSLSIVFSVQGTGGSPTGPDPENRVGDQETLESQVG
jgi:hypothetical protein